MDAQEKIYTKGFNHGYLLAQHEPEIAEILANSKNEHSWYFQGFSEGKQEYELEKILDTHKEKEVSIIETVKTPEEKYIKGFNIGYQFAEQDPELLDKIVSTPNEHNEYFQGLLGGKKEYEIEVLQNKLKSISENKPDKDDKDMDKER